jgi:hypothetical protein
MVQKAYKVYKVIMRMVQKAYEVYKSVQVIMRVVPFLNEGGTKSVQGVQGYNKGCTFFE